MQENKNSIDIGHLTKNLSDALDVSSAFVNLMQEELVNNAVFRGKIEQTVENIDFKLNKLNMVVVEGNGHSLIGKLDRLDQRMSSVEADMKEYFDENKASSNRVKERFWSFIIQNGLSIMTWIVIAIYGGFQFFSKK